MFAENNARVAHRNGVVGTLLAASLVQQIPCKDCWIVAVRAPINCVHPIDYSLHIGLVPDPNNLPL